MLREEKLEEAKEREEAKEAEKKRRLNLTPAEDDLFDDDEIDDISGGPRYAIVCSLSFQNFEFMFVVYHVSAVLGTDEEMPH